MRIIGLFADTSHSQRRIDNNVPIHFPYCQYPKRTPALARSLLFHQVMPYIINNTLIEPLSTMMLRCSHPQRHFPDLFASLISLQFDRQPLLPGYHPREQ